MTFAKSAGHRRFAAPGRHVTGTGRSGALGARAAG
jgi:hypothetical protein